VREVDTDALVVLVAATVRVDVVEPVCVFDAAMDGVSAAEEEAVLEADVVFVAVMEAVVVLVEVVDGVGTFEASALLESVVVFVDVLLIVVLVVGTMGSTRGFLPGLSGRGAHSTQQPKREKIRKMTRQGRIMPIFWGASPL